MGKTNFLGRDPQASVVGPQRYASHQSSGGQQLSINVPDAQAEQPMLFNQMQDLIGARDAGLWKQMKGLQRGRARADMSERNFPNDKWMYQRFAGIELSVFSAQMSDPNRSVDEDHRNGGRRRGGAFNLGLLPPRRANRRAASRSTRAFSA